ncbi:hypothetical protein ACJJTC_004454 [Scirpophaga incertulas]
MVRESDESFKSREENDEIYEPSQNIDLDNIGGSNMVLRPRHNKELHEANVMELQLPSKFRANPNLMARCSHHYNGVPYLNQSRPSTRQNKLNIIASALEWRLLVSKKYLRETGD